MGARGQNARCAAVVIAVGLVGQGMTPGIGWASAVWLGGLVWLGFIAAYAWHDTSALRAHGAAVRALERAERAQARADARLGAAHAARVTLARWGGNAGDADAGDGVRFVEVDDDADDTPERDRD